MKNNNQNHHTLLKCAALELNLELGTVKNTHGETQRLSPINLNVLSCLLARQGEVISRTELFDEVWPNQIVSDDVLTRAISDIRTQLARLDSATKFIETLPKRGYRWAASAGPAAEMDTSFCAPDAVKVFVTDSVAPSAFGVALIKGLVFYVVLALFLAAVMMWVLTHSLSSPAISLAVLPAQADRVVIEPLASALDDALLTTLRKNTKVNLLSKSAIASRPHNPFPYFFSEFGAKWVLESRVSNVDGVDSVELSLVDARTGLEVRNLHFNVASRVDILHKVAQKIETDLLIEPSPY